MEFGANTILITGGASGIGLALAERFLRAGSQVIICGRREEKLREAQARCSALAIRVCDVAEEGDRIALARWASTAFPLVHSVAPAPAGPDADPGRGGHAAGREHGLGRPRPAHLRRARGRIRRPCDGPPARGRPGDSLWLLRRGQPRLARGARRDLRADESGYHPPGLTAGGGLDSRISSPSVPRRLAWRLTLAACRRPRSTRS
jgi:short chain dehydrogenase